ncbi:hypothetical protein [Chryseobacterium rhizosphaerae]|uniref:hypothetical protein n=1 Tax=Chryseobacterium rhizosphaerae TaxID=395937 RepID=UPI0023581A04|nr:hypothetical protein [Chryseobacterium rhizosphaerae]MDC8099677.1 hypothetical protein [Chryseobacterium rhizosphaerae]
MKQFIPLASVVLQELFKNKSNKVDFKEIELMISIGNGNKAPYLAEIAIEKVFKSQTGIDLPLKEIKRLIRFKNKIGGKYGWNYYKQILHYLVPNSDTIFSVEISKLQRYYAKTILGLTVGFITTGFLFIMISDIFHIFQKYSLILVISYFIISSFLLIFVRALESEYKAIEIRKRLIQITNQRS